MLNEKTLELNISTEFLNVCHRYDPHAFMFGTTLRQEKYLGYDSRALGRLPQLWRTAVFQFKKALRRKNTIRGEEYTFRINNNGKRDQQIILYLMSGGRPRRVLYVLPLFMTLNEVRKFSPNLLKKTFFADAADFPPWYVDNHSHALLVYPRHRLGIVQSERREIKIISFEEILTSIAEKKLGLTIEELLGNLKAQQLEGARVRSTRPRFTFQIFPSSKGKGIVVKVPLT